jgi:hypothetical protein
MQNCKKIQKKNRFKIEFRNEDGGNVKYAFGNTVMRPGLHKNRKFIDRLYKCRRDILSHDNLLGSQMN